MVERALRLHFPEMEVVRQVIVTTGDRRTDVSLDQVAKAEGVWDKGVFVKELEVALHGGEVDLAVHSLKDLPSVLEDEFELGGVLERAGVRDVLVTRGEVSWDDLGEGKVVGTSSVRRAKQVQDLCAGVEVCDLRGNVPTRLRKLAESEVMDGILLAEAGMERLGYVTDGKLEIEEVTLRVRPLEAGKFLPAASQGAVGLEVRAGDAEVKEVLAKLNHEETMAVVTAEREFLKLLEAGCHTPVGVWSEVVGEELRMRVRVYSEDEGEVKEGEFTGKVKVPKEVARGVYEVVRGS
nr:porphobilinogen deaminase-like [Nerophis lumbriciformis]